MSLLDALHKGGHLRTLDHALAQSLRRLDRDTPDAVLAAAALASLAVAKGHAGVRLGAVDALVEAEIAWPDADAWTRQLEASRWVDTPDDATAVADPHAPLVLEGGLLYLRRYREYERALALGLQRIATQPVPEAGIEPASGLSGAQPGAGMAAQIVPGCHGGPKASRTSGSPKMLAHFGSPTRRLRRSLRAP